MAPVIQNPDTYGTILLAILVDAFGTEFFEWEPEMLRHEIMGTWGVHCPQNNMDKVLSLVVHMTTNQFYRNLDFFIHTCNALSGSGANFHSFDPANVQEIAWALAECLLLEPQERGDVFDPEIVTYTVTELMEEGFTKPPKILADHFDLPDISSQVNDALTSEELDYNAYWDAQQRKRIAVDTFVARNLNRLIIQLSELKLENADQKGVSELRQRAYKALAGQQAQLTSEQGTVAKSPSF